MKKQLNIKDLTIVISILLLLAVIFAGSVHAQDTVVKSKKGKNVIVLKVKADSNGKTTIIDTTFTLNSRGDMAQMRQYMRDLHRQMGDLRRQMREMELSVNIPEMGELFSDSIPDSTFDEEVYAGRMGRQGHHGRAPRAFTFSYSMPAIPDAPPPPPPPDDFDFEGVPPACMPDQFMDFAPQGKMLNELLEPIPMDRVKNYQIKERKGGKRIIIDVDDEPVGPANHKEVIIINGKRMDHQSSMKGQPKKIQKEIIIETAPPVKEEKSKL
jgi:hypothetical protein